MRCGDGAEEVVSCDDCGVIVLKISAQQVRVSTSLRTITCFYCSRCEKPYTRATVILSTNIRRYFKELEVDKDGTPIGYKKINDQCDNKKSKG